MTVFNDIFSMMAAIEPFQDSNAESIEDSVDFGLRKSCHLWDEGGRRISGRGTGEVGDGRDEVMTPEDRTGSVVNKDVECNAVLLLSNLLSMVDMDLPCGYKTSGKPSGADRIEKI
jgi:hypothetical protein